MWLVCLSIREIERKSKIHSEGELDSGRETGENIDIALDKNKYTKRASQVENGTRESEREREHEIENINEKDA